LLVKAPPSRVYGSGYAYNHPAPTVQQYKADKTTHDKEAEEYAQQLEAIRVRKEREAEEQRRIESQRRSVDTDHTRVNGDNHGHQRTPSKVGEGKAANEKTPHHRKATGKEKTEGQMEKEQMMDRMNANQVDPITRNKKGPKGERRVCISACETASSRTTS